MTARRKSDALEIYPYLRRRASEMASGQPEEQVSVLNGVDTLTF